MIRVRLSDFLTYLDRVGTENTDFEDWLEKQIPSLDFDCMDFPNDAEDCFDCYFKSSSEESDANAVYRLLKDAGIESAVGIVDDKFNLIKETEG